MKTFHSICIASVMILLLAGISCSKYQLLSPPGSINSGFPVGYYNFTKNKAFNFQLNRLYSLGYLQYEDLKRIGGHIESFEDWNREFVTFAFESVKENRLMDAAFCYRAAEFYTTSDDPDKKKLYHQFTKYFYKVVDREGIIKSEIPYGNSVIHVLRLLPSHPDIKGTIIIHGGYDSFKEELYSLMVFFQQHNYEVITFEMPWIGESHESAEMGLDIAWEKPIKAVLDYFNADDVTLIGISMGGWLSLRAAAFEPRINRVIASSVSFDVNKYNNVFTQKFARYMFENRREKLNTTMLNKMEKNYEYAWFVNHLMYVTKKESPVEAFDVLMTINEENLHSELVNQDVLILTGRKDHMVPYKMHKLQVNALVNANSVTERIFTKEESGQNHCQIGNIGLALNTMLNWIEQ